MADELFIHPFPGLRHFETSEEHLFFGREGQSEEILRRLSEQRFVAVVGSSGSGKSSLVRAGLLPYVHGGFLANAGSRWRVAIFRPGNDPIVSLAASLNQPAVLGKADESPDEAARSALLLEVSLRRSGLGLIETVRLARLPPQEQVLIIVDQFEELFRFANSSGRPRQEDDAAAFVKLLLEARAQSELPIYIVLTMRSDFIGDCARYRDLPEVVATGLYLIPRMTREQRRSAITNPVRVGGGTIAPRLVNRLLNDVGEDPDQLPIMQHALMRVWDHWHKHHPDGAIDLEDYLAPEVGGMAEALSRHAGEAYDGLPSDHHRAIARRIFQALTEKGPDNREARRPTTVEALVQIAGVPLDDVVVVLDAFRAPGRSFLMPPASVTLAPTDIVDISHESLIRGWRRLRAWVDEEAESAKVYRRLADTAALHAQGTAGLWHDPDLEHALAWHDKEHPNAAWAERYDPSFDAAMAFLEKSRVAREAEREAEERRRTQELRRARRMIYVTSTALVIFAILGAYAVYQQRVAERAAGIALAKEAEAKLAVEDQRVEVRRSRQRTLSKNDTIADLAETIIANSAPFGARGARVETYHALTEQGDQRGALRRLDEVAAAFPDNLGVLSSRGYINIVTVNPDAAIKDIERYLEFVPEPGSNLNLSIAKAMKRDYAGALAAVQNAIKLHTPFTNTVSDTEVSPDIQAATGRSVIYADSAAFLIALYYQVALLHAFTGSDEYFAALDVADQQARVGGAGVEPCLFALEWAWLQLRGQDNVSPTQLKDYGILAVTGALWERVAESNPRYFAWAREYYKRFQSAYEGRPEPRYAALLRWTSERLQRKEIDGAIAQPLPPQTAEELELEGRALESKSNTPLANADAHQKYTAAIDLLESALHRHESGRNRDVLISLLLRRGNLRKRVEEKKGAREDAERVIALNPRVYGAYTLLAELSDGASKRDYYEKALEINPSGTLAMAALANVVEANDPKRALDLRLRRSRLNTWVDTYNYERIVRLQLRLGQPREAMENLKIVLTATPRDEELYLLRRDIERALGQSEAVVTLHLAAGYRAVAEANVRIQDDSKVLLNYMRALQMAAAAPSGEDARFEIEAAVRGLTDFLVTRHSVAHAQTFWTGIASSSAAKGYQDRAREEARRLSRR